MSKIRKYQIWDRTSRIRLQTGEILTPEQYIERIPIMGDPDIVPVIATGDFNGRTYNTLGSLKQLAELNGAEFTDGLTDEELLQAIEDFEYEINKPVDAKNLPITPEERTAAALEFIAMNSLPDENKEEETPTI